MVRIPKSDLRNLRLRHSASAVDLSLSVPEGVAPPSELHSLSGYTRWVGLWSDATVHASWNWGVLLESLVIISPHELKTNIRLAEDGVDLSVLLNKACLLEWIESLAWRDPVWETIVRYCA
jgi:hypothetical protein